MLIYPAIDIYEGKAVRLYQGDYAQMTVYSENPYEVALDFKAQGAERIHVVDLEGAKAGESRNLATILKVREAGLFTEVGGGIRDLGTVERYLEAGIDRVILGTAAVTDPAFLAAAIGRYGERIAVSVDLRDGFVAVKGWTEQSGVKAEDFFSRMVDAGVRTVICTDISRDGAMCGTNRELYRTMQEKYPLDIIASGGVSSLEDVAALAALGLHGAIIGKAYYTHAIDLKTAVLAAAGESGRECAGSGKEEQA